jgi:RNA polymerase sigma factor (sigma-70 family)
MEFIHKNDKELRAMVFSIAARHQVDEFSANDIAQEFYHRCLTGDIIESYDPNFHQGKSSNPKISTYLYQIILNMVRSYKNSNENRISSNRYTPSHDIEDSTDMDDTELALRFNRVAVDYENILLHNDNSPDNLSNELREFERAFLNSRFNKQFSLKKRRNKTILSRGLSILEVYNHFKNGLSSHDIAELYGVSDMFICYLKKYISKNLKRFGILLERYNWQSFPVAPKKVEEPIKFELKTNVSGKDWSDSDVQWLRELYPVKTLVGVAKEMGRSVCSIKCKIYKLNIKKS